MKQNPILMGVTVFGDVPYEGARRMIGLTKDGPVYGQPEPKTKRAAKRKPRKPRRVGGK